MTVKDRIETRLKALGRTKTWLATALDVKTQNLNNWFSRNKIPELYLFNAARTLKCDPEWLATGSQVREATATYQVDPEMDNILKRLKKLDHDKAAVVMEHMETFIKGLERDPD